MFYNPNVTWNNSWLAAAAGDQAFADVHKIKGLRGIYIANQLTMDAYNSQEEQISPDHLESVITFDQVPTLRFFLFYRPLDIMLFYLKF